MPQTPARPPHDRQSAHAAPDALEYRVITDDDHAGIDAVSRAGARGFLMGEPTDAELSAQRAAVEGRRHIAVFDASLLHPDVPVATVGSWTTEMSTPGGRVPMWAISAVTVAPTHRRRGIARSMLERELRDAADAGVAVAGLTASEATIYGRYGFGIATTAVRFTVDTRRAGWVGAETDGRIEFIDREELAVHLGEVHEKSRWERPGDVRGWSERWREFAGIAAGEEDGKHVRGVRYIDAEGQVRGAMAYRVFEPESGPVRLDVRLLAAASREAEAALWRFAVQYDLVDQVTADHRPVDDPLPWLVLDTRAVTAESRDFEWLRILDVPAALSARAYAAPVSVVLDVDDPLGYGSGAWLLQVDASGSVSVGAGERSDEPRVALGIVELSSLFLGGVSLRALADAGRVRGSDVAIAALANAFHSWRAPQLSIGY